MNLGVNIDHIAVLREARKIADPDPLMALEIVREAGADQITIHLREDRRHIYDEDVIKIINNSKLPVNLECSLNEDIIDIVSTLKPFRATLVPENRQEITTEGGIDVFGQENRLKKAIKKLHKNEIEVSLFIDPSKEIVKKSKELGVEAIEFHTGKYANIYEMLFGNLRYTHHSIKELELSRNNLKELLNKELKKIKQVCKEAEKLDLFIAAGHGLNYQNVKNILKIKEIKELNIGQSIIARSIFTGLSKAVKKMNKIVKT